MQVGLLGPLTVGDGATMPSSRQERAVLEVLALRAPRAVPAQDLHRALWGDAPPRSATKALPAVVSRLRRRLPPLAVAHDAAGYRLVTEAAAVDVHRFEQAAEQGRVALGAGRDAEAAEHLGLARDLWRGAPLVDVDPDWCRGEVTRLEELHRSVIEDLIDARSRRDPAAAVGDAEAAVEDEPLRERRWVLLIDALARSGRAADALRAYQRAVGALADVGLEPGVLLREAEQRVLSGEVAVPAVVPTAARRSRLPHPRSSFIARDAEREALHRRLRAHALVTLVGPAGVGKTRLAIEVVRHDRAQLGTDDVLFADLVVADDEPSVWSAVGDALGTAPLPGMSEGDAVASWLGDRTLVVVLDNCEHVLGAVAAVATGLLDACPNLRLVATSRQPLGVTGEVLVPVGPLATGERGDDPLRSPAARLLLDRLDALGGAGDGVDGLAVATICEQLDGLPLALELAATTVAALGASEVATRLDRRFELLGGDDRTGDARHRTLHAALSSSWDLLDADRRRALDALSVFRGTFAIDGVECVVGSGAGDAAAARVLAELVERSLVEPQRREPGSRHRLLQSVREFAAADLASAGATEVYERRHTDWVLDLAAAAEVGLQGIDQPRWLDRLADEHANLAVAFERCTTDPADAARALRAASSLFNFWMARGRWREDGAAWCVRLAELAVDAPAVDRVQAIQCAAMLLVNQEPRRVEPLALLAAELAGPDRESIALAKLTRAWFLLNCRPGPEILALVESVLPELPPGPTHNLALVARSYACNAAGDWERAYLEGRQAAAEIRANGDEHLASGFLGRIVDCGIAVGRTGAAAEDARTCLDLARRFACPSCEGRALVDLALLDLDVGEGDAITMVRAATAGAHELDERAAVLSAASVCVGLLAASGHHRRALLLDGALESALVRTGFANPFPARRLARAQGVATAASALGDATAERVRAEGARCSYADLVRLVCEVGDGRDR